MAPEDSGGRTAAAARRRRAGRKGGGREPGSDPMVAGDETSAETHGPQQTHRPAVNRAEHPESVSTAFIFSEPELSVIIVQVTKKL